MIRVGMVGYGYWGPNLARNFVGAAGAELVAIADSHPARLQAAADDHPAARITADAREIVGAPDIDAVAIATPPTSHPSLAMAALAQGKHVLIEKPPAADLGGARAIVAAAEQANRVLMVDHTFVFAPAVDTLASIIRNGEIGDLVFVESTRSNLARFDPSIGVIRDLAVHDLAILACLLGCGPTRVAARGRRPADGNCEEVAFISLDYGNGLLVHLHVNCTSPVKVRRMSIGGTRGLAVYDDIEPTEKVRVYRRDERANPCSGDRRALRIGYRTGTVTSPPVEPVEPLARMVGHFLSCINSGAKPFTDGGFALRALTVVAAAERSLAAGGVPCTPDKP